MKSIATIPFIFYSFFLVASVLFIVKRNYSFGPMYEQEKIAQETGNLFGGKDPLKNTLKDQDESIQSSLLDFLVPVISLLLCVLLGLLYSGNYYLFGGDQTFVQAVKHTDIFFSLFIGSVGAIITSIIFFIINKKLTVQEIPYIIKTGFELMGESIVVLFLAWTFSTLLREDLKTGNYLAQLLIGSVSVQWLPLLFFIASSIISIGSGSSWGTFSVMIPLGIPMLITFLNVSTPISPDAVPLLFPLLGAIFAGSIIGDHISPIASTTIMVATSTSTYLMDHVKTQFYYALPAIISTFFAYTLLAFLPPSQLWFNWFITFSSSLLLCLIILYSLNMIHHKKLNKNIKV